MRRLSWLLIPLLLTSCACRKTDAQKAQAERDQLEERIKTSLTLLPYRLVKIGVRAKDDPRRPPAVDALQLMLAETQALPPKPATTAEVLHEAATYARLLKALYDARETMKDRDEDEFPPLAQVLLHAPLPPPFDMQLEHLGLSAFWFIVDSADQGKKIPGGTEYVFYELARATPQPGWPKEARWFAQLLRGGAFCAAKYHYAAEEELTAYVTAMETTTASDFTGWTSANATPAQTMHGLRAAGYFVRAWNRMGLEREEGSTEDLEKGLTELQALGVENELTQWGWALVHARRGRFDPSAAELDKLAQSPHLDEKTRTELTAAAAAMRSQEHAIPLMLEARATFILAQALLSRAGGVEHLLTLVVGEEHAKKIALPLTWLERTRRGLAGASPSSVWEKGKQGLELLKK
ncbi:MAG: hypothetical protein Q8L48_41405 [Archangium sp.]|nr:hypothetical protein [Archangium sp.]